MKAGVYCPFCSKAFELEREAVVNGSWRERHGVCVECDTKLEADCAEIRRTSGYESPETAEKRRAEYKVMKQELKNAFRVLIKARNGCNDVPVGLRDDVQEAIIRMVQNFIWIEDES